MQFARLMTALSVPWCNGISWDIHWHFLDLSEQWSKTRQIVERQNEGCRVHPLLKNKNKFVTWKVRCVHGLYRILYTSHYSVNAPLSPFCCCFDCCISDCVLFASLWIWSVVFGLTFPQFIFLKSWTSWSMKRTLDEVFLASMTHLICWKYWSTRGYETRKTI